MVNLGLRYSYYQGANILMTAGAFILTPTTFGLGTVAVVGIKSAMGLAMEYNINQILQRIINDFIEQCLADTPDAPLPSPPYPNPSPVGDPVWLIDPSGYVYEVSPDNRLQGVIATLLHQDQVTGDWYPWDAGWFGQSNPLTTDAEGKYAWDVPEGNWKVV